MSGKKFTHTLLEVSNEQGKKNVIITTTVLLLVSAAIFLIAGVIWNHQDFKVYIVSDMDWEQVYEIKSESFR